MKRRIAVGGSAANPPTRGHLELITKLWVYGHFHEIHWFPSGGRLDKGIQVDPDHRVAMTILTFPRSWLWKGETRFIMRFSDVYGTNTPTFEILKWYRLIYPEADLVWFTGADSVTPQERFNGKCEIEAAWDEGEKLMRDDKFLVIPREGYPHPKDLKLPPQFEILDVRIPDVSSSMVRDLIARGEPFEHLVTEEVAEYIKHNKLYGYTKDK